MMATSRIYSAMMSAKRARMERLERYARLSFCSQCCCSGGWIL